MNQGIGPEFKPQYHKKKKVDVFIQFSSLTNEKCDLALIETKR
jgi:hypothetical protein